MEEMKLQTNWKSEMRIPKTIQEKNRQIKTRKQRPEKEAKGHSKNHNNYRGHGHQY